MDVVVVGSWAICQAFPPECLQVFRREMREDLFEDLLVEGLRVERVGRMTDGPMAKMRTMSSNLCWPVVLQLRFRRSAGSRVFPAWGNSLSRSGRAHLLYSYQESGPTHSANRPEVTSEPTPSQRALQGGYGGCCRNQYKISIVIDPTLGGRPPSRTRTDSTGTIE